MAQRSSCSQSLRTAERLYDQGLLEEIPELLSECLALGGGFERAERIRAHKLLALTYIFLDEPKQAEKNLGLLLKIAPETRFHIDEDPAELIYLYETFRTEPIFSISMRQGTNINIVRVLREYGVDNTMQSEARYSSQGSFNIGPNIEFPLSRRWSVGAGATFSFQNFAYFSDTLSTTNLINGDYTWLNFTERQRWMNFPLYIRYNLVPKDPKRKQFIIPYIQLGSSVNWLLKTNFIGISRRALSSSALPVEISGADLDVNIHRRKIVYHAIAGAGLKLKLGANYVSLDLSYNMMLRNIVNTDQRYANSELLYRYGYVDNDFHVDNVAISVGYSRNFYHPVRRKKYR